MASRILYKASVEGDLRKIDRPIAAKLLQKLESVLSANPRGRYFVKGNTRGDVPLSHRRLPRSLHYCSGRRAGFAYRASERRLPLMGKGIDGYP